jgi:hypothetical protein
MLGVVALGRLALGRFRSTASASALPAGAGTLALAGQAAQLRAALTSRPGDLAAVGSAAGFTEIWSAGGGPVALSHVSMPLRVSVPAQDGAGGVQGYAARLDLVLRGETGVFALAGVPVALSKTTPGGGDDHVITFRGGGPAFTRARYRRMLNEQAAKDAAAVAAAQRSEAAARAKAEAASARVAEARHRRFQAQDVAAALVQGALGKAHAQQSLAGAQALAARGRGAEEVLGAAITAARVEDDNEALALLLAA